MKNEAPEIHSGVQVYGRGGGHFGTPYCTYPVRSLKMVAPQLIQIDYQIVRIGGPPVYIQFLFFGADKICIRLRNHPVFDLSRLNRCFFKSSLIP
jgi:hypothetical protein